MTGEPRDILDELNDMAADRRQPMDVRSLAQRAASEIRDLREFQDNWEGRTPPRLIRHRRR